MNYFMRKLTTRSCGRTILKLLSVWMLVLIFTALTLFSSHNNNVDSRTADRLSKAILDLEILMKQNAELRKLFEKLKFGALKDGHKQILDNIEVRVKKTENLLNNLQKYWHVEPKEEPNIAYEKLRRRIGSNIQEMWSFFESKILKLQNQTLKISPDLAERMTQILTLGKQHKRSLLKDVASLAEVDGYSKWREREEHSLSDLVQRRIKFLQNPADCNNAKKLICNLNRPYCGYGCRLHHAVYCLIIAYGTERTMILRSKGWRYRKQKWDEIFKPVSDTCTYAEESQGSWLRSQDQQIFLLPYIDVISPQPPFVPLAIPEDLAPRLQRLHGNPPVWWVGQFLKYLLRPQPDIQHFLQEAIEKLGFKRPIVGVHVRRSDKLFFEAVFHSIDEYMVIVEEYYNQLELTQHVDQRRVYLASDEPKVILETKRKYPNYEILCDPNISKTAAESLRHSHISLKGLVLDIHLLSMSDFLVCTFSSHVCRAAYEIMQYLHPDAESRFKSLDDIYYFDGQTDHKMMALFSHKPNHNGELELSPGDIVTIDENHWDGYSKGRNMRTNVVGIYPTFKVEDKLTIVKFPTYPGVPIHPPRQHDPEAK